MYIEMSCYYEPPVRPMIEPRERYKRYYKDLYGRYNMPLDEQSFLTGSQYAFHELSYPLFNELERAGFLNKIDLMVAAFWLCEFDPSYSAIGPHLADRYHFRCPMFDVVDQGSVSPLTALFLIMQYQSNAVSETALCFSLEQTTVPRSHLNTYLMPRCASGGALILSISKPPKPVLRIKDIVLWTEKNFYEKKCDVIFLILKELYKNNIKIDDCIVYCKRSSTLYRAILFYQYKYPAFSESIQFSFLPVEYGCGPFFQFLDQVSQGKIPILRNYLLLLEEDVESLVSGMVILQWIGE